MNIYKTKSGTYIFLHNIIHIKSNNTNTWAYIVFINDKSMILEDDEAVAFIEHLDKHCPGVYAGWA